MQVSKNGLYDTYPIYYIRQLKRAGRRDMGSSFLDYWDDYRSNDIQANAYYAKCWHNSYKSRGKNTIGISKSTASAWITEFNSVIANFEASWELFENNIKDISDRSVQKSIGLQVDNNKPNKEATKPKDTKGKRPDMDSNRTSIGLNNKTNNNNNNSFSFDKEDLELSKTLYAYILNLLPTMNEPNLEEWASISKLMRVKDNKTIENINNMMKYIYTDDDDFGLWNGDFFKGQILDMKKLRQKYNQMALQIKIQIEKE
ncbi:MAG: hypothetical protein QM493_10375 [Sulfurovum sp.]